LSTPTRGGMLLALMVEDPRQALTEYWTTGVAAVDPGTAVRRNLHLDGEVLDAGKRTYPLAAMAGVRLAAAGKGAPAMAAAVEELLGEHLIEGLVVTKDGVPAGGLRSRVLCAGHPVPDRRGLDAARELEAMCRRAQLGELLIWCCSGGASAMLPAPAVGLTLEDKRDLTRLLLGCGADIAAINAVRKHCSRLKGGGLVRLAAPAQVLGLLVSDVPGDEPATIGSGMSVPDPTTFADAWAALDDHGLVGDLPPAIRDHLFAGLRGEREETLDARDPPAAGVHNLVVAANRDAVEAAAEAGRAAGLAIERIGLEGDVEIVAADLARRLRLLEEADRPVLLIAGGETTVLLPADHGVGGRNQHLALCFAREVRGRHGLHCLSAGTDGDDGETSAAGGFADGRLWERAADRGLDPQRALERCDAHPLLKAVDACFEPGPTGTNVSDLVIAAALPGRTVPRN